MQVQVRIVSICFCSLFIFSCGEEFDAEDTTVDSGTELSEALTTQFAVADSYGRALNTVGITLVDWQGYIANPAKKLIIQAPATGNFPLQATLSANHARLYFDTPSTTGAEGPSKSLNFSNAGATIAVYVALWPDRNAIGESHTLSLSGGGFSTTIAINVIDQDNEVEPVFPVLLDFSQDTFALTSSAAAQAATVQAARDWSHFLADMHFDAVAAQDEASFIWNTDGFTGGQWIWNSYPFTGFLLYSAGIRTKGPPAQVRSGGAPSLYAFQHSGGKALPLRRSGSLSMEVQGNYNNLGWSFSTADDDWWQATNLSGQVADYFSIVHHEMGHALFFHPGYSKFSAFKQQGFVSDVAVKNYLGFDPPIDVTDHFPSVVDPMSKRGAFGNEFANVMPYGRWIPTKLDLLLAQAVGYVLRPSSVFAALAITDSSLVNGKKGSAYADAFKGRDGIPAYYWSLSSGSLPPGLSLNSFSGQISGKPNKTGTFNFTIRLRDNGSSISGVTRATKIVVN